MNNQKPSREEIIGLFEDMATIQTLPQYERIALQYYLKGIIAAMSGQLPTPTPTPTPPASPAAAVAQAI